VSRHLEVALIAIAAIAVGLIIRANAEQWSSDGHQLLQDIGAALLGFGTLLVALSTQQALTSAPNRPAADALPPSSSPSGRDNG
jgi:hypothetical protein